MVYRMTLLQSTTLYHAAGQQPRPPLGVSLAQARVSPTPASSPPMPSPSLTPCAGRGGRELAGVGSQCRLRGAAGGVPDARAACPGGTRRGRGAGAGTGTGRGTARRRVRRPWAGWGGLGQWPAAALQQQLLLEHLAVVQVHIQGAPLARLDAAPAARIQARQRPVSNPSVQVWTCLAWTRLDTTHPGALNFERSRLLMLWWFVEFRF